jgi:putative transposase
MRYRRAAVPGGTFFFTVNLADRDRRLLVNHIEHLRSVFRRVQARQAFRIDAIVILPEHLHTIWTLPEGDKDFATRWMLIKMGFSRAIPLRERRSLSRASRGERGIWQRRYWEHQIRDEQDFIRHVEYIHYNPVKHGHVPQAADWPYSSFHKYVAAGIVARDWGAVEAVSEGDFGERQMWVR